MSTQASVNKILQLGYEFRPSGTYQFTTTHEYDELYRRYLARRADFNLPAMPEMTHPDALPVDISMDDIEGDVVAGLAGAIHNNVLLIDLVWVDCEIDENGIDRRLIQMAEEVAIKRDAHVSRVRVGTTQAVAFYIELGYEITGTVQNVPKNVVNLFGSPQPAGLSLYWLAKDLD